MQCPDSTELLRAALAEDIGPGDVTAKATIPANRQAEFAFVARESLVVAGLPLLSPLFALISPEVLVTLHAADGDRAGQGATLAVIKGSARALLSGERTALNLLQQLSGVATLTRRYVDAVAGTSAKILDTRKTIPGLRALQKYAVACGGGTNHRMGLYDAVLIKDNHIAVAGGVGAAVKAAQAYLRTDGFVIQVECDTLAQVDEAIAAGATMLLLDNMDNTTLIAAVNKARAASIITEASGNVNLDTVRTIAESGVDRISIGRLTHSAPAVDIGLDNA